MDINSFALCGTGNIFKARRGILENFYTGENAKKNLTHPQIKLFDFSLSEIDPANDKFTFLLLYDEYFQKQGITSIGGRNKTDLINDLEFFRTNLTSIMLLGDNGAYYKLHTSWFEKYWEYGKDGKVIGYWVTVNKEIALAMLKDTDQLIYPYVYSSRMQSKYGHFARLYFLALDIFDEPLTLTLKDLASHIDAMNMLGNNYRWPDFHRKVVMSLINDINNNAMDMEIIKYMPNKEINKDTGKEKTASITFWIRRILNPINIHEVCEKDKLDFAKIDAIKNAINYDSLCELNEDKTKVETAIRIIYAAYLAIEKSDSSFSAKFGMTDEQMRRELDSMTMMQVHKGLEKAYCKKRRLRNMEIYVLQCILDVKNNPMLCNKDENLQYEDTFSEKMSELLPTDINLEPAFSVPPNILVKAPKFARATREDMRTARQKVESIVDPNFLSRLLIDVSFTENQKELIRQTLNDFYEAVAKVFYTNTPTLDMGKPCGHMHVSAMRQIIEEVLTTDIARDVILTFSERVFTMKLAANEKSRRSYILKTLWNKIYILEDQI